MGKKEMYCYDFGLCGGDNSVGSVFMFLFFDFEALWIAFAFNSSGFYLLFHNS